MIFDMIMTIENEEDRSFVERIYIKYERVMYWVALQIVRDHHDAQDCVHDTVQKIIRYLDKFKNASYDESYLKHLVIISCRNMAINIYNENKKRGHYTFSLPESLLDEDGDEREIPDQDADLSRIVINEYTIETVQKFVGELSEIYRDVVILKYYYDMENSEISNFLNISEDLVRTRLMRAKKILLEKGGKELYEAYISR